MPACKADKTRTEFAHKVFVFLGPSLALEEASAIFPDAVFLPPAKCGNILQLLRFSPKAIVLIDGYFEQVPAVWHKEILYALSQNIPVFGASSMGALRAAELAEFGMRGQGRIYEAYANESLSDDDEVALLHGDAEQHYRPLTLPMINVRFTLDSAYTKNIISKNTQKQLLQIAKTIFYQQRNLDYFFIAAKKHGIVPHELAMLEAWWSKGYIDQKRIDAIDLLQALATSRLDYTNLQHHSFNLQQTALLRTLHIDGLTKPFFVFHPHLPALDKIALLARLYGRTYLGAKQLARLLGVLLETKLLDLDAIVPKEEFFQEYAEVTEPKMCSWLKITGDYTHYKNLDSSTTAKSILRKFATTDPIRYRIIFLLAYFWDSIEEKFRSHAFEITPEQIIVQAKKFMQEKKLFGSAALEAWLQTNELSLAEFMELMAQILKFDFIVNRNNIESFAEETLWHECDLLNLSLQFCGLAQKIIADLSQKAAREQFLTTFSTTILASQGATYALLHDFEQGYRELLAFIELLKTQAQAFFTPQ